MKKKSTKYDVFISYRRDGGDTTAQLLCDRLTRKGYRVAYDIDTLRSGKFDQQLLTMIEQCQDVIVVLSPGALDRCVNENDWVRQEIAHAIKCGKNIVPVLLRNFVMPQPEELPLEIRPLVYFNGVGASHEHFESSFARINSLLHSKPVVPRNFKLVCGALVCILAGICTLVFSNLPQKFPRTNAERNCVSELIGNVSGNIAKANILGTAIDRFYDSCQDSLSVKSASDVDARKLTLAVADAKRTISPLTFSADEKLRNDLRDTPISGGDFAALPIMLTDFRDAALSDLSFLSDLLVPANLTPLDEKRKILRLYRQNSLENRRLLFYGLMDLLSPISVDNEDLKDMRLRLFPTWINLPFQEVSWSQDKAFYDNKGEQALRTIERNLEEISQIVGNQNQLLHAESAALTQKLTQSGISPEQAQKTTENIKANAHNKLLLKEIEQKVAEAEERLRQKFAPQSSDEPGILWGKVLRFLSVSMDEDAMNALQILQNKHSTEYPEYALKVAEQYIRLRKSLPFAGGVMVVGFEPPATAHDIYQIGDIVTAIDGKKCRFLQEYHDAPKKQMQIYRLMKDGTFKLYESTMPPNQPRVALIDMMEED